MMHNSSLSINNDDDDNEEEDDEAFWNEICHASSLFHRAQSQFRQWNTFTNTNSNSNSNNGQILREALLNDVLHAHGIYRSCRRRIRRQSSQRRRKQQQQRRFANISSSTISIREINLELRMAACLRFMACVCMTSFRGEDCNRGVPSAIRYHDDAVSLLVGVFDDGDNEEEEDEEENCKPSRMDDGSDESTEEEGSTMVDDDDRVVFSIRVHADVSLLDDGQHNPAGSNSKNSRKQTIQLSFLRPTENQRVRAIATSLNALASLHARMGDDRSAMDSYREALEILRAATEEEEDDSDDANDKRGTTSKMEYDLAATLMNVGTFHLRRDELDAARNAYSTVFALHSGTNSEDERHAVESKEDEEGKSPRVASSYLLPHLNSPTSPQTLASAHGGGKSVAATSRDIPSHHYSREAISALSNLGIVHERRGELLKAISCYDRVLRSHVASTHASSVEVADCWINMGNCLQRKLDWDGSEGAYAKAVQIYRRWIKENEKGSWPMVLRVYRALSGALRNHGTCCWKQRRISDAVEYFREGLSIEENIVRRLSTGDKSAVAAAVGSRDGILQAKLSMAQLLGYIGCLYLEHASLELRSFQKSKASFQRAIQIYFELGYHASHPSIVWAGNNLQSVGIMEEKSKHLPPPPPPPPTPPPKKRGNAPLGGQTLPPRPKVGNRVASTGPVTKEEGDSVFSGVEDDFQSSMDELDEILSEKVENTTQSAREMRLLDPRDASPFDEEEDFDEGFINTKAAENPIDQKISDEVDFGLDTPLSSEHANITYPSFGESIDTRKGSQREEELKEELNRSSKYFGDGSTEAARAHVALANQFWQQEDRGNATEHYTIAHSIYESLGDRKACAVVLKALGDLNKEDEKLDAAKELYREAMDIEVSVYGHCLPQTLNAAGVVCLLEDDHRSAMEFHRRALQIQQKSLDEENKYDMYETLVLIGNVYYSERNNLTNIQSKGVDYKEFIESGFLGWIAKAHDMRGEYIKACQFYEESLQIAISKERRESKKEMALTLNRLGSLNRELGRYEEALDYHQRALLLQQSTSNSAKAMTAETCVLMGMTKAKMGEYQNALDLYEDSLIVLKAVLGDQHLSVAQTMVQIGAVHLELSNYDTAMTILSKAEEHLLATVGEHHRDTFETQALLGRLLSATGKYDSALVKLHGVAENQAQMFGENHPLIADTNQFIGECFLNQGMAAEARAMFLDCYNMRKRFFSMDQLTIAESMVDIIRARSGRPERSLAIYGNAMEVYHEYLSDNHVQIGHLLVYEGDAHAELLDFSTAVDRYHKASVIFRKAYGEGHIVEADILVNVGKVLLRKCDYDGAKAQFCKALDIYNSKLPEGHPKIVAAAQHLDRVEQEEALCV
ncbi:hypothetical protein ACHAW6_014690 [Cyclotella cf. meneghiniana]